MSTLETTSTDISDKKKDVKPEVLRKTIWSIAGGKGGTGKTVLAANISIGMAVLGYKVIVIDADLGVPNLHNYLGIKRPRVSLDDFMIKKYEKLPEVIIETPLDNLRLITGAANLVGIANLQYSRKQRLIRHINKLDADIIIVDLGAGISNNTMDFFNISSSGLIVSNPEPNANQDAYFFTKNVLFRRMKNFIKVNTAVKNALDGFVEKNGNGTFDFNLFREFIQKQQPAAKGDYDYFLQEFHPRLIMNKIRSIGQKKEGKWFINLVNTFLGIEIDYIGGIRFDKRIIQSAEKVYPFVYHFPRAKITKDLYSILSSLNASDMPYHSIRRFKEFRAIISKQKNLWH